MELNVTFNSFITINEPNQNEYNHIYKSQYIHKHYKQYKRIPNITNHKAMFSYGFLILLSAFL